MTVGVLRASPARVGAVFAPVLVFALAAAARLTVVLRDGGLRGSYGYDSAVYFAAADALVHGRLPYDDFTLLHPPALMLVLTPFAALAHLVSDQTAFSTAVVAFALLGAVNAVLVMRVCQRLRLPGPATVAGGLTYALWFGAIHSEFLPRLEPLGNFFLLLALLFVLRARDNGRGFDDAAAGVALGLLLDTKIWWALPVLAVGAWHAWTTRSGRRSRTLVVGVVAAVVAVCGPFFAFAPGGMWRAIVPDQLGRPTAPVTPWRRLADFASTPALDRTLSPSAQTVSAVIVVVLLAAVVALACTVPAGRACAALLVGQVVVLLAAPSWFGFYTDYLSVALALTVAAAVSSRWRPGSLPAWLAVAGATTITTIVLAGGTSVVPPRRGEAALTRAVADVRCVMSDSPAALIELNALSRGFEHGCPNWVDVTGRTYSGSFESIPRIQNPAWQREIVRYLRSGGAVLIARPVGTGLSAASLAALRQDGVLARAHGQVVYYVRDGCCR